MNEMAIVTVHSVEMGMHINSFKASAEMTTDCGNCGFVFHIPSAFRVTSNKGKQIHGRRSPKSVCSSPRLKIKHCHRLRTKHCSNPLTRWLEKGCRLIELLHSLQQHGIQIQVLKMPHVYGIKNRSTWEKTLCNMKVSMVSRENAYKLYPIPGFGEKYKPEMFFDGSLAISKPFEYKNYLLFHDKRSRYVNIMDHKRPAVSIPEVTMHTIYIVGDSTSICFQIMDEDTVASFLQGRINEEQTHARKAVTFSTLIYACGAFKCMWRCLSDMFISEGDIVVITASGLRFRPEFRMLCEKNGVAYYDTQRDFHRPHNDGELFKDYAHTNPNGNRKIAEILYNKLFIKSAKLFVSPIFNYHYSCINFNTFTSTETLHVGQDELNTNQELLAFVDSLKIHHNSTHEISTTGTVVMTCNPFTLGHLHLVEVSAAQVDKLYEFVVEEDKMSFSFNVRLQLIQVNTVHVQNLVVLPSSRFIISGITLPGYFVKDEEPDIQIDASMDLKIFCRWITPALSVHARFVGEEPLDRVTKQYNVAMGRTLPRYGVALRIIMRKELDNTPISASRVRALLLSRDFYDIAVIVPVATITFLLQKFVS